MKLIEKELGRELPEDIMLKREEFSKEIVSKRWVSTIEQLKEKYNENLSKSSTLAKKNYFNNFGIRFTHDSNKIEGSTLTLREVQLAIEEKNTPINKSTTEINEAQCHMMTFEDMRNTREELTMDLINKWHKILFSMHPNRNNFAGLIRKDQIYITGSKFVPPPGGVGCEMLLEDLFNWYKTNKDTVYPVLLSCLMKFRFVSIHPYGDGNGRMSRLLMNYILHHNHYPMFNISADIRKSYLNALEKANMKEDEMLFIGWFFKNYLKYIQK